MNQKGFNLFTALISVLLIMLAVLLIQSMIQTERNTVDTITANENRSRLEATAEMARADAMQVFNYALRKKIEDWLTDPERGGLTLNLQNRSWDEIKKDFAESKFSSSQADGSQFAKFTASSLEGIFYSQSHFGTYTISLEGAATLETGIKQTISKSLDDFFTVIECPDGDPKNCPKGTFYVNLHIERLTQKEYENLPKLHVIDRTTGEELKEILLPRTTFRIYVPLRFFKAIAEARALAHYPQGGGNFGSTSWIDTGSDSGLFSPKNHNEIEKLALGMCDYGSCKPRENPLQQMSIGSFLEEGTEKFCPGDASAPSWQKGLTTAIQCTESWCPPGVTSYNANNNDDWKEMKDALEAIAVGKVCSVVQGAKSAGYIDTDPNDKFTVVGTECGNLAQEVSVNIDARESKVIGRGSQQDQGSDPGRNLGLYIDGGIVKYPDVGGVSFLGCSGSDSDYKSRCSEVKSIKVTLAFKEEDPNYMVRETKSGEERIYRISVYDNTYLPFTANWDQGSLGADSLYSRAPTQINCSMVTAQGWYCVTKRVASGNLGEGPVTDGCVPG